MKFQDCFKPSQSGCFRIPSYRWPRFICRPSQTHTINTPRWQRYSQLTRSLENLSYTKLNCLLTQCIKTWCKSYTYYPDRRALKFISRSRESCSAFQTPECQKLCRRHCLLAGQGSQLCEDNSRKDARRTPSASWHFFSSALTPQGLVSKGHGNTHLPKNIITDPSAWHCRLNINNKTAVPLAPQSTKVLGSFLH